MLRRSMFLTFLGTVAALHVTYATLDVPEEYDKIGYAIDDAVNGDTVSVLPGTAVSPATYVEALDFGSRNIIVAARNSPTAYSYQIDNPDPEATVIDADTSGGSVAWSVVKISGSGELRGFTIINGDTSEGGGIHISGNATIQKMIVSDNSASSNGGGIYIGAVCSPTIRDVIIRNNSSSGYGGGIFVDEQSAVNTVTIDSCEIRNNTATGKGGGIACTTRAYGEVIITNCTIEGNYADYGGGIYSSGPDSIYNCIIRYDTAGSDGGGIYCDDDDAVIVQDSLEYNRAVSGGGIAVYEASPTIDDNYIGNNTATSDSGGGIYMRLGSGLIKENTIKSNSGGAIYCFNNSATIRENEIDSNTSDTLWDGIYIGSGTVVCTTNIIKNHTNNIYYVHGAIFTLNAEKNYWGSIDTDTIEEHIYESSGPVDFDPIRFNGHITYSSVCSTDVNVTNHTYVDYPSRLKIHPGMTFRFSAGKALSINGKLIAEGTQSDTITFTSAASSPSAGDWNQIYINPGRVCSLSYCRIEYAETGINAGTKVSCSTISGEISDCMIYRCELWGIGGRWVDSTFTVSDNDIAHGGTYGIKYYSSSTKILGNRISHPDDYGIWWSGGSPTIRKNLVSRLGGYGYQQGMYLYYTGGVVDSNEVSNFQQAGAYLSNSSSVTFEHNLFRDNDPYGLHFEVCSPAVYCCEVTGSTIGVLCAKNAYPVLGDTSTDEGQYNSIHNNTTYHVSNQNVNPDTLKAEECWWGQSPPDARKFNGPVDYDPYLDEAPDCEAGRGGGLTAGLSSNPRNMFRLSQNFPNPVTQDARIAYQLPEKAWVNVSIYNSLGQSVRTLVNEEREPGNHLLLWNGRDSNELRVPSGVYFLRMEAGRFQGVKKMVVLR